MREVIRPSADGEKESVFSVCSSRLTLALAILFSLNAVLSASALFPFSLIWAVPFSMTAIGLFFTYRAGREKKPYRAKLLKASRITVFVIEMSVLAVAVVIIECVIISGLLGKGGDGNLEGLADAVGLILAIISIPALLAAGALIVADILHFKFTYRLIKGGEKILNGTFVRRNTRVKGAAVTTFIQAFVLSAPLLFVGISALVHGNALGNMLGSMGIFREYVENYVYSMGAVITLNGIVTFVCMILSGVAIIRYGKKIM